MCATTSDDGSGLLVPTPLGRGYLVVRSRLRVTRDGGHSLLAIQDPHHATRLGRASGASAANTDASRSDNADAAPAGPSTDTSPAQGATSVVPPERQVRQQVNTSNVSKGAPAPSPVMSNQDESILGGPSSDSSPMIINQATPLRSNQSVIAQRDAEGGDSDSSSSNETCASGAQVNAHASSGPSLPSGGASSFHPILRFLDQTHRNGYPRVAYSYLASQLVGKASSAFNDKAELQASLDDGVRAGQIISVINDGNRFLSLPADSFDRALRSTNTQTVGVEEDEFARLLKYLRQQSPVKRRKLRKHFMAQVPDTPYGQTPNEVNSAIDRACKAGVVNSGGEGKTAWISLPK
jgi:hypothetical protein